MAKQVISDPMEYAADSVNLIEKTTGKVIKMFEYHITDHEVKVDGSTKLDRGHKVSIVFADSAPAPAEAETLPLLDGKSKKKGDQ